jgi:hypothetical protein
MKKFSTIIFRNYFNYGDLHAARSLIRYVKDKFHGFDFKLMHPRNKKAIGDIDLPLIWRPIQNKFDNRGYHIEYNSLIINTQYLAFNGMHFNKDSASIVTLYNIFNHTLNEVFGIELPKTIVQFLPRIKYKHKAFEIDKIDKALSHTEGMSKILICNNDFGSEQAMKFDFDRMIEVMADTYPNIAFYVSNKTNIYRDNVKYVPDILGECGGCDLNEISYLSTKCKILIGRNSGPHTYSYVLENILSPNKTFISFSPPSGLYGKDPDKWIDFGCSKFLEKDKIAKFKNVIEYDDQNRIRAVMKIIEGGL